MGNDHSRLKGLVIEQAVESNDFWTLSNANLPSFQHTADDEDNLQLLSVFQGEPVVSGQLWVSTGPMERAIKNLKIYRHPYIIKYISTWDRSGQKHLATERVQPLISVLSTQSDIQVCLGLRTILCSLIFLIEKALARHLNICTSSIYITESGSWRLAGFEYVWKGKEVNKTLLDLAKAYRNNNAIDPCELKENNIDFIEQYAFATLCEEILSKCTKSDTATPHVLEFREYCAQHLKHKNAHMRPKLSAVLLHPYFNHEFVLIHSFLFELPLKSVQEKQDFFTGLIDRLRYFNEEVVGAQLAADLLSRMVLLDPTAQLCVTPYVLRTKTDYSAALFSNQTYLHYLMPHIRRMFRLRDAQIRLILLEYFMEYVRLLTKEEVQDFILPHLMAGMNDTNDVLVAKTLRCMADLVPKLGAAVVLGGNRARIFSDGRPQAAVTDAHWVEPRSITPVMGGSDVDYMVSDSPLPNHHMDLNGSFNSLAQAEENETVEAMPPRLSPDGGEDNKSAVVTDAEAVVLETMVETIIETVSIENGISPVRLTENDYAASEKQQQQYEAEDEQKRQEDNGDDDAWSDWETDELQHLHGTENVELNTVSNDALPSTKLPTRIEAALQNTLATNLPRQNSHTTDRSIIHSNASSLHSLKPPINDDLNAFDIKVQKSTTPQQEQRDEFDFFKDMEPVIDTKRSHYINTPSSTSTQNAEEKIVINASRFAAAKHDSDDADADIEGAAWRLDGDDDALVDIDLNA